jgi:hypothetical protein
MVEVDLPSGPVLHPSDMVQYPFHHVLDAYMVDSLVVVDSAADSLH